MAQCHWTTPHDEHEWTPIIQDPEFDGVLRIFTGSPVICPGL